MAACFWASGRCFLPPRHRCRPQSDGCSGSRSTATATAFAFAFAFAGPTLRSLDAIHLATAQILTNESGSAPSAFVTYDRRLLDSAKAAGLPTASPGQE